MVGSSGKYLQFLSSSINNGFNLSLHCSGLYQLSSKEEIVSQGSRQLNEDNVRYLRRIHIVKTRVWFRMFATNCADLVTFFLCPQRVSDFEHEMGVNG